MGDRCYMSVTCLRKDRHHFEQLGFVLEFEESPESITVELVDLEANYAHTDKMPANVPYYGYNGSGSDYGEGRIVCDGKHYAEVAVNQSWFVVVWDYQRMKPAHKSVLRIRRFISIQKRVKALFDKLKKP